MRTSRSLLLCFWLAGTCRARVAGSPAPRAQVGVLAEGLLRLLSGVEENGRSQEREAGRADRALRRCAREAARLGGRVGRAGRLRAWLRRDLRAGEAREEGLRSGAEGLLGLTDWGALERGLARVREIVRTIEAPAEVNAVTLDVALLRAEIEAQTRRLSELSQELIIQDGLLAQQDQRIAELQMES